MMREMYTLSHVIDDTLNYSTCKDTGSIIVPFKWPIKRPQVTGAYPFSMDCEKFNTPRVFLMLGNCATSSDGSRELLPGPTHLNGLQWFSCETKSNRISTKAEYRDELKMPVILTNIFVQFSIYLKLILQCYGTKRGH